MSILFFGILFIISASDSCIPVSLSDDTDGFTTTTVATDTTTTTTESSTTVTTTTASTTSTTTTPPNCLTQCQSVSSFTDCANIFLPPNYVCMNVSPTPTATRAGTTCSFTLDCSSLGATYMPQVMTPSAIVTCPGQTVSFSCPDGGSQWTDSYTNMMDSNGVCAMNTAG